MKLEFREVEREVYVARGEYELTPLPGQEGKGKLILTDETITTDEIQIFGTDLVPNSGAGGGTGEFDEFLGWLGRWIGTPIVSEVDLKPTNQVSWHLHERSPSTEQTRSEDHDPILVLGNITLQTGMTLPWKNARCGFYSSSECSREIRCRLPIPPRNASERPTCFPSLASFFRQLS